MILTKRSFIVLNLIINGLPSIPFRDKEIMVGFPTRFKPYYKWITFNTHTLKNFDACSFHGFKPYYKWITFNT